MIYFNFVSENKARMLGVRTKQFYYEFVPMFEN